MSLEIEYVTHASLHPRTGAVSLLTDAATHDEVGFLDGLGKLTFV